MLVEILVMVPLMDEKTLHHRPLFDGETSPPLLPKGLNKIRANKDSFRFSPEEVKTVNVNIIPGHREIVRSFVSALKIEQSETMSSSGSGELFPADGCRTRLYLDG